MFFVVIPAKAGIQKKLTLTFVYNQIYSRLYIIDRIFLICKVDSVTRDPFSPTFAIASVGKACLGFLAPRSPKDVVGSESHLTRDTYFK